MATDPYPTKAELAKVKAWPWDKGYAPLMEYVKSLWWMPDWGWHQDGLKFSISTGGWSGNESLIDALERNYQFWSQCWETARRGGHYTLEIPDYVAQPQPSSANSGISKEQTTA